MNHLKNEVNFLNIYSKSGIGILDIFKYILKVDVAFMNFPEEMIDKRFGFWQFLIFIFVITPFFKLTKRKLVWTMHNRKSHYSKNKRIKKYLYQFLLKHSDIIVVHASVGKDIVGDYNKKLLSKVFYFPHPVIDMGIPMSENEPIYDFIIWGRIAPYKSVDSFLEYLHTNKIQHKYKILIAGKVQTQELEVAISKYLTENIILINRDLSDDELIEYISSSRIVLFPYIHESVLASGALVYSLNFRKPIIGPHAGAFLDLSYENLVFTFRTYEDIEKIDTSLFDTTRFSSYVKEVSWEVYTSELMKKISKT